MFSNKFAEDEKGDCFEEEDIDLLPKDTLLVKRAVKMSFVGNKKITTTI